MTGARPDDPLATLARDYSHGLLTRETYRQQRARLLDDLLGGGDTTNSVTRPRTEQDRRRQQRPVSDPQNLGRRADDDRPAYGKWIGIGAGATTCSPRSFAASYSATSSSVGGSTVSGPYSRTCPSRPAAKLGPLR